MKKTLISLATLMMALPVMAAQDCAYSPLQNLIRNVRDAKEIQDLMNRGVVFNEQTRCGGSLMQLAILRGNPQVLNVLLQKEPAQANEIVKLDAFPIPGARREVPLILFAAYYAPNPDMIKLLINVGKADISKTDSDGRNLLWYMDQNPVLRNTALFDDLNNLLLYSLAPAQQKREVHFGTQQPAAQPTGIEVPTVGNAGQPVAQALQNAQSPSVVEAESN